MKLIQLLYKCKENLTFRICFSSGQELLESGVKGSANSGPGWSQFCPYQEKWSHRFLLLLSWQLLPWGGKWHLEMTVKWHPRYCYSFVKIFKKEKKKREGEILQEENELTRKKYVSKSGKKYVLHVSAETDNLFFSSFQFSTWKHKFMCFTDHISSCYTLKEPVSPWEHENTASARLAKPSHPPAHLLLCTGSTAELFPTLYLTLGCNRDLTAIFRLDSKRWSWTENLPNIFLYPYFCRLTWTRQSTTFQVCAFCWNTLINNVESRNWLL